MRGGDDAARGEAVNKMRADAQQDPATYGYSAFLSGANSFITPTVFLRAQAAGTMLPQPPPPMPDQWSEAARLSPWAASRRLTYCTVRSMSAWLRTSRSRQAGAPPSATSEANVWRP